MLAILAVTGCSQRAKKNFAWPWSPEIDDAVGITTPAQRLAAMKALAENADKQSPAEQERVTADLAKQIQDEQDPMIRRKIVDTLGHFNTASANGVLQAALADSDPWVRVVACQGWGRKSGPEAVEKLANLLSGDTNLDVRLAAAKAIGKTKDKAALQSLAEALSDSDPAVHYCVLGSLREISGKDYGNDVELWRSYAKGENPKEPDGPSIAE
ncbi:MAG TPA: HEAT repeat domain-containing protein, partial [Planctomycetaceae bacterium]